MTIARTLSDTFAGIYPMHAPAFIVMQFIGAGAATALFWWLVPPSQPVLSKRPESVTPDLIRGPEERRLDPGSTPG